MDGGKGGERSEGLVEMEEVSVHRRPDCSRTGVQQYTAGGMKAEER